MKDLVKSDTCCFIQIIISKLWVVCLLNVSRSKLQLISIPFLKSGLVWTPLKTEPGTGSFFGRQCQGVQKGEWGEKRKEWKPITHYRDPCCRQQGLNAEETYTKHKECLLEFSFQRTGVWGIYPLAPIPIGWKLPERLTAPSLSLSSCTYRLCFYSLRELGGSWESSEVKKQRDVQSAFGVGQRQHESAQPTRAVAEIKMSGWNEMWECANVFSLFHFERSIFQCQG